MSIPFLKCIKSDSCQETLPTILLTTESKERLIALRVALLTLFLSFLDTMTYTMTCTMTRTIRHSKIIWTDSKCVTKDKKHKMKRGRSKLQKRDRVMQRATLENNVASKVAFLHDFLRVERTDPDALISKAICLRLPDFKTSLGSYITRVIDHPFPRSNSLIPNFLGSIALSLMQGDKTAVELMFVQTFGYSCFRTCNRTVERTHLVSDW